MRRLEIAIAITVMLSAGAYADPPAGEADFLSGNDAAMATMMRGMEVKPTGDVDKDFAHMMIPHHQGAIDMAILELRYGHNPALRRLAQEIIVTQQQEIAAMALAIHDPLPASRPTPTDPHAGMSHMAPTGMQQE